MCIYLQLSKGMAGCNVHLSICQYGCQLVALAMHVQDVMSVPH